MCLKPELMALYRRRIAYGEDPIKVKEYLEELEKIRRMKKKRLITKKDKQKVIDMNGEMSLTGSKIIDCLISDENNKPVSNKKKYTGILKDVLKSIGKDSILENSLSNISKDKKEGKGWYLIPELNVWFQNRNANSTMNEIKNMVIKYHYHLNISIQLKNGKTHIFQI